MARCQLQKLYQIPGIILLIFICALLRILLIFVIITTNAISKEDFFNKAKSLFENGKLNADGKNIVVNLKKGSNNITITIDDDGPGIEEKQYENVFKPFYKIDKSRGDSKSSVGLGMSIASDIIQSHGGSIKLEKSHLNGLRVKIFLPF